MSQEYGEPDILYLNDGKGRFTPLSWTNGAFLDESGKPLTGPPQDWGLTAAFRDLNGNGAPDIYVCNDYWTPDRLWLNDGKGHFRAAPRWPCAIPVSFQWALILPTWIGTVMVDFCVTDMLDRDWQRRKRESMYSGFMRIADRNH